MGLSFGPAWDRRLNSRWLLGSGVRQRRARFSRRLARAPARGFVASRDSWAGSGWRRRCASPTPPASLNHQPTFQQQTRKEPDRRRIWARVGAQGCRSAPTLAGARDQLDRRSVKSSPPTRRTLSGLPPAREMAGTHTFAVLGQMAPISDATSAAVGNPRDRAGRSATRPRAHGMRLFGDRQESRLRPSLWPEPDKIRQPSKIPEPEHSHLHRGGHTNRRSGRGGSISITGDPKSPRGSLR